MIGSASHFHRLSGRNVTRLVRSRRLLSSVPSWASYDPAALGTTAEPYAVSNIVDGKFLKTKSAITIINPMDKDAYPIFTIPDTQIDEIDPFIQSLRKCPKSGMHNPLKNPERYVQYGEISRKVGYMLHRVLCCGIWLRSGLC